MSVAIIRGTNNKKIASKALTDFFQEHTAFDGQLFIGYPVIASAEGRHPIDALWVSPSRGIVVFDLVEGTNVDEYSERQDDSANKLEARLKNHRELMDRRRLRIDVRAVTFAPAVGNPARIEEEDYPLANLENLAEVLDSFQWDDSEEDVFASALSAIQNISTIRKSRTKRVTVKENSRGAKLKDIENKIATLDNLQSKAVIETVDGVQRIRGLAGSGKTVVLALKAAYLHAQHPEWRIAVTFNTRSLKGQFRRFINTFSLEQTGEEPNWENLRILNAWGAPGAPDRSGIYYEFCRANELEYFDFNSAKGTFGRGAEFSGAIERALIDAPSPKPLFDAMLVDEAQDFPPAFLRLCYKLLDDHKRLVYAYDELQNLGEETLTSAAEIFGVGADGAPLVNFEQNGPDEPRRDIILDRCYRNSKPVLVTAHALGFGIYRDKPKNRDTGLVQMFDQSTLWEEIGYRVEDGELKDGAEVSLVRTEESSPSFLQEHSPVSDLVKFVTFESEAEQNGWLAKRIIENLKEEELRHDDIVVINTDPFTTRQRVGSVRRTLLEAGVNSHLAGVDTDPDIFFELEGASVTFTGIYRAKGNEAGMVYIMNAQDCAAGWNLATIRNRLFTAITRSKAWVRVLGYGPGMGKLVKEFERLKEEKFALRFTYPTKEQREQLRIVHRDMTPEERKRIKKATKGMADFVKELESGSLRPEDVDKDILDKIRRLLK